MEGARRLSVGRAEQRELRVVLAGSPRHSDWLTVIVNRDRRTLAMGTPLNECRHTSRSDAVDIAERGARKSPPRARGIGKSPEAGAENNSVAMVVLAEPVANENTAILGAHREDRRTNEVTLDRLRHPPKNTSHRPRQWYVGSWSRSPSAPAQPCRAAPAGLVSCNAKLARVWSCGSNCLRLDQTERCPLRVITHRDLHAVRQLYGPNYGSTVLTHAVERAAEGRHAEEE